MKSSATRAEVRAELREDLKAARADVRAEVEQKIEAKKQKVKYSLALKTSLGVAIVLVVILAILVASSVVTASINLNSALSDELTGMAAQNGITVQNILFNAASYADDLQKYLEDSFERKEDYLANQEVDEEGNKIPFTTEKSQLYNVNLLEFNYEVESYILYTAWSAVSNDDNIVGIGVFFEPNAFDPSIKDYTVYVGNNDAVNKTAQSYGDYADYGSQDYYTEAANTRTSVFTKPYKDQGVVMITAAYPVIYNGETQAVIVVDITTDTFDQLHTTDENFPSMYGTITMDDSTIIYDSEGKDQSGVKLSDLIGTANYADIAAGMATGKEFNAKTHNSDGSEVTCFYYPIEAEGATWWSSTALRTNDLQSDTLSMVWLMIGMSIFAVIVIVSFVSFFVKKMLKPIDGIVTAADEISKGHLDIKLEIKSQDEIGALSKSFMTMTDDLRLIIKDLDHNLGELASGNFRVKTDYADRYIGDYRNILMSAKGIKQTLSVALSRIGESSQEVNAGAEQVSNAAQALSQGSTEQAASVEELSATIEEVSRNTQEAAANAQVANALTAEVGEGVRQSNEKMQDMLTAMSEISNKSEQINKIIKAIDDIAFQTNILALNAAVEAARAGEAGKGFAVVADEVRNLAQKSAEAVKSTTLLIGDTVDAVSNGMKIADETAQYLQNIVEKTNQTVENIQKIADASNEQAGAIAQITTGVDQISAVIQTNAATAEESAAASKTLSGQSQILEDLIAKFKLEDVHY